MSELNTTQCEKIRKFKKKTGVMLVATGILSRVYARQVYAKNGFDITPEQFVVLELLVENGSLYQRQMSEITMKDRPNISRIVDILERKGYVKRVEDKNKRKIYKILVTEKGKNEFSCMQKVVLDIRKVIVDGIKKEDMDICLNVLSQVQENLLDKVNMQI